jgi:hypothetical protein
VFIDEIEVGFVLGSSSKAIKSMSPDIKGLAFTMVMLVASINSNFMQLCSIKFANYDKVADLVN